MKDPEILELHRNLIAIPALSRQENGISDYLFQWFAKRGCEPKRQGNNLFLIAGDDQSHAPRICLNTHLDTVPPAPGWTRNPHQAVCEAGRVYGLGSNDAKASLVAMVAAFVRLREMKVGFNGRLLLTLVAQEEVGGKGTEELIPELKAQGLMPDFAMIGEPTGLDIAVAQKGLLILELIATGKACHAAHRKSLNVPNAIRSLARDLMVLDQAVGEGLAGKHHPLLGDVTMEPTVVSGGTARNINPAEARCFLDLRVNPKPEMREIVENLQSKIGKECELKICSDRLKPYEIEPQHPYVKAALESARTIRSSARTFGSRSLSDLVFFREIPAIKVGPGISERSHTADEYVLESEILEGAQFYEKTILNLLKGV